MLARLVQKRLVHSGRIRSLATVVAGADDPATPPDHVADIAARVPGARFRVLPGAHLPILESADAVTALLLDQIGAGVTR